MNDPPAVDEPRQRSDPPVERRTPSETAPEVAVGARRLGAGRPVYVIAEAGVNHNGDIATAHRLVDAAHGAGAAAVKFQLFNADRLVSKTAPACDYQRPRTGDAVSQHDMLRRLELDPPAIAELEQHASRLGIDFLLTPFGLEEVEWVVRIGVPAIKIASTDLVNEPLVGAAAETGLPLILSTGAADASEIDRTVGLIRGLGAGRRLVLLHCVSAYPTPPEAARLGAVRTLGDRYGVPVGFSDHTQDPRFGALAVAAGACVLEKHFTLDRNQPGPDHFFSLEPDELAEYVGAARRARAILGTGDLAPSEHEMQVRELGRGSIVTRVGVPAGTALMAEHLMIQRPAGGIDPSHWSGVLGRVVAADIPANKRLEWSMMSAASI